MIIKEKTVDGTIDYSVAAIQHICEEMPPREPGSDGEKAAQDYLAKDIIENNWADTVDFQPFEVAPKAFMGFSRICPILTAIGIALFWWLPFAPIIFSSLTFLVFFFQFLLYWKFLDPLYKKSTSHNVIAVKKATGEVKNRIILSGHSDAAYEWTVFNKMGAKFHIGSLVYCLLGVFTTIGIGIAATVIDASRGYEGDRLWMLIVMLIFVPGLVCLFLYSNYNRVVPGANDNLTGCLGAVGVLKCLKEENIEFENTEVICLLTGSEEAGLRGAKVFAKEYKDKIMKDGVDTCFIGLETFRDYEHMAIYARDLSGTVKSDARVVKLLDKAADGLYEKPLPHSSVYIGASDGAAMVQAGIPACTLASMDPAPARYYHTRYDSPDNLNPKCMKLGLNIALKAVELFDKDGLKQ